MNEHLYESEFHRAITGNARERVGYILQRNVVARNDDMECLWEYFRLFDQAIAQIGEPPVAVMTKHGFVQRGTNPETILREKRYLQNTMGLYKPMPHIQQKREQGALRFREKYSRNKQEVR